MCPSSVCTEVSYTSDGNFTFTVTSFSAYSSEETPTTAEEDTTSQGGGGTPTFYPTESDLQEGYTKQLYTNWKLKFKVDSEEHQLKLDSFDKVNKTATVTVSSDPQTKTLLVGESWKVNLDNDSYYDLLVRLDNVTSIRANVFIKNINESIPAEEVNQDTNQTQEPEATDEEDCFGGINCWFYIGGGIVLVLIILVVAFFIGKKYLKKKKK